MLRLGEPLKKWAFPLSFVKWKPVVRLFNHSTQIRNLKRCPLYTGWLLFPTTHEMGGVAVLCRKTNVSCTALVFRAVLTTL